MGQAVVKLVGEEFMRWWPDISAQLDTIKPMWDRWWTKESIYAAVVDGYGQCWASLKDKSIELVVFTTVNQYPANKILLTNLAFGRNIDEHLDLIDATLENFAYQEGCAFHEVRGRPGWKPRLQKKGYEFQQIMMFKAIPHERRH